MLRACVMCDEYVIPDVEPTWKNTCKSCYIKKKKEEEKIGYRSCDKCGSFNIVKNAPDWKTTCGSCYVRRTKKHEEEKAWNKKLQKLKELEIEYEPKVIDLTSVNPSDIHLYL